METTPNNTRALRLKDVCHKTGISRATVYDLISKGQFPPPRKLGCTSVWLESEIDAHLASLPTMKEAAQ